MKIALFFGLALFLGLGAFWLIAPAPNDPAPASPRTLAAADRPKAPKPAAASRKFATRLAEWAAATDPYRRNRIQAELEAAVTDGNAAALTQTLTPDLLETPVGLGVLGRWARLDRPAALEWLAGRPKATPFQIAAAVRDWAGTDRESLHRYLDAQPHGDWRNAVLAAAGTDAVAGQDPEEAISLAQSMDAGDDQTRLLGMAVRQWAQWDPNAAADFLRHLDDADLRKALVPKVAAGYASTAPADAAQWLLESLGPGTNLERELGPVLQVWAREFSARDAAAWIEKLPAGSLRDGARRRLAEARQAMRP